MLVARGKREEGDMDVGGVEGGFDEGVEEEEERGRWIL